MRKISKVNEQGRCGKSGGFGVGVKPEQLCVSVGLPEAIIPAGEGTRTILEGLQKPIWVSKSEPEERAKVYCDRNYCTSFLSCDECPAGDKPSPSPKDCGCTCPRCADDNVVGHCMTCKDGHSDKIEIDRKVAEEWLRHCRDFKHQSFHADLKYELRKALKEQGS